MPAIWELFLSLQPRARRCCWEGEKHKVQDLNGIIWISYWFERGAWYWICKYSNLSFSGLFLSCFEDFFTHMLGWNFQDGPLELEFDESIVQRVAAILSRGRDVRPREREGSSGLAQSGSPVFRSGMNFSQVQRTSETAIEETHHLHVQSSDGSFSTSDVPIRFTMQPPSPVRPAAAQSPRVTQRPSSPENSSLSESLKSKFSSASARFFGYTSLPYFIL